MTSFRSHFLRKFALTLLLVVVFFVHNSKSQEKYTISGYIKEASSGEYQIGATVLVKDFNNGTVTNAYGFYSLTLDKGNYHLTITYLGFKDIDTNLVLDRDIRLNIEMYPRAMMTKEVIIDAERPDKNVQSTQMGTTQMNIEKIKALPAFMGEVDILKTIQLLPGVQSGGEGNTGFYVRGGGPDQNLILLDEATVYNASHLFGFFSVFNSDAIKNITLIKGGMPANYGGRLASVLDIAMKEGNNMKFHAEGGIGLISSRLTVQGPILKKKASFIVSGRRTYADVLAKPFVKSTSPFKGSGYYFYDLNTKINYELSDKDKFYLSGYFGRDVFTFKNSEFNANISIPWGNATLSTRWNHLFSNKLFMNTSLIFTDYKFSSSLSQDQFAFTLASGVRDWNLKTDVSYYPTIRHNVKFGALYIYHTFMPNYITAKSGNTEYLPSTITKFYANEGAIYATDDFDLTDKIRLNFGLRFSAFEHIGPYDRFIHDSISGKIIDTTHYKTWQNIKLYDGLEPRFSIRYSLNMKSSLKASFTMNNQYVHMASLSTVSLPTDLWIPSSTLIHPQLGAQYAFGYFRNFKQNKYETSIEVYYKDMKHQIDYKEGSKPEDSFNDNIDASFTYGKGWSYGMELFFKKALGKFTGWVGYTLSYTNRQFNEINGGIAFPARYDRRHDLSVTGTYELDSHWVFSAVFVYYTGVATTMPVSFYMIENRIAYEYGVRNSYRLAPYHRMDLSVTYTGKKHKTYESSWNLSVYNAYNRYNPYFVYIAIDRDRASGIIHFSAQQVSLFPIIPSITWNFKF